MLDMIDDHARTGEISLSRPHRAATAAPAGYLRRWNVDWSNCQRTYGYLVDGWVVYDNLVAAPQSWGRDQPMADHDLRIEGVPTNPNNAGRVAAMHGAAVKVRPGALMVSGSVMIERDGKAVYESGSQDTLPLDGVDEETRR